MKKDPTATEQQGPKAPKAPEATKEATRSSASGGTSHASAGAGTGDGGSGTTRASSLLPAIASPKGGGAIRGIGEKFSVNAATGTASLSVPIATSPGRSGFGPELSLSYDSGSGNGPFGLGFHLSVPAVTRKTDKGLPRYWDEEESDVYVMSGAEDLVPELGPDGKTQLSLTRDAVYTAYRYRPRVEGAFVRIERWVHNITKAAHWRVTTRENVTHIYGRSGLATQIADPSDSSRVFSWLIEESRDDKGNVIRYEYKAENGDNVPFSLSEKSRFDAARQFAAKAQRYLKRILYGNREPNTTVTTAEQFLFEVVFDYGEHAATTTTPTESGLWGLRQDPFSSNRSGFEVRTYRLCQRVLMFHRFGPVGSAPPVLVKSTDFTYDPGAVVTYLTSVRHRGYIVDSAGVITQQGSLPELSFAYQRPALTDTLTALPQDSLEGLAGGVDGGRKQWVDLDGEGIAGVLIDADGAWYYKSNLGQGKLTAPKRLTTMPSPGSLVGGVQKLEDVGGDGQLDLVQYGPPLSGYFTRTPEGGFEPHRTFQSLPNLDWNDPNLRFIDLDGDGHGDLLITEDHAFIWYHSKAKGGFEAPSRVYHSSDEDNGPAVVFADGTQSIQLADMSGDGLVDIVRVRNGEVCYWPNLGYGRFGAKITLEQSPVFAQVDQFDARRLRFADIDGSGTTDLFYLGPQEIAVYLNESGNRLSAKHPIRAMPPVDNVSTVSTVDLLGQGTTCLVWSSSLPAAANRPVFYIDLMGGQKPHLLHKVTNNLGAETRLKYSTSTQHYLRDKQEGLTWLTRLSFPVQVVDEITHEDFITKSRLVTTYRYHHGFFDGVEREFRGFACVEQWDKERFEESTPGELDQEPVHTKTWFHTGAWLEKERLEERLKEEYFPRGKKDETTPESLFLPDTVLPLGMSVQDEREAARALRGHVLRTEVYADDGTDLEGVPYVVTEQNFAVRRIQSSGAGLKNARYGVFFAFPRETVTIHTERHVGDPRVGHELILEVDGYGNVTRKASVVYGRRVATPYQEQTRAYATLTETKFTQHNLTPVPGAPELEEHKWYRASVQYAQSTYEITGIVPPDSARLWTVKTLTDAIAPLDEVSYETPTTEATEAKRLVERKEQTFCANDGATELGLGEIESLALPFQAYQFALTPGLVDRLVERSGTLASNPLTALILTDQGKYQSRADGYWVPGGRIHYQDAEHFHLPDAATDPFDNTYTVEFDDYSLLIVATSDPLGNRVVATNDYRVLAPVEVRDPNLNRSAVGFDALGMVIWTAVMGKEGANQGDTPEHPTTRFEYFLDNWTTNGRPSYVKTSVREVHFFPDESDAVPWQDSFTYSDGFGRVVMQKVQAEAGLVPNVLGEVTDRWVGTGRTVFNNKGNPVKQYEPFFSATSDYEDEDTVVQVGVTPVIHYDALDRVIRTDLPNGTLSRVVFDAWRQENWDPNDNVLHPKCTWYLDRTGAGSVTDASERRAATLAAAHANTPSITHLDSLGRAFRVEADNGPNTPDLSTHTHYVTTTKLDIEGNQVAVIDALGIPTIEQEFDVLGRRIVVTSPDAGQRVSVADVGGKPLRSWDSRGQTMRSAFDKLQRPTHVYVKQKGSATEDVVVRTVYGESLDGETPLAPQTGASIVPTDAQALNLRGQTHLIFDGGGLAKSEEFDFKGNLQASARHLASTYDDTPTWNGLPELGPGVLPANVEAAALTSGLETETSPDVPTRFTTSTEYDALNRVTKSTAPDNSANVPVYNRANFLERMLVTAGTETRAAVHSMAYNEKGQRLFCEYSAQAATTSTPAYSTRYTYDEKTFRLKTLVTRRTDNNLLLQSLSYTYDPVGNIAEILDTGTPVPIYTSPVAAEAHGKYEYDALYRLVKAEGREHPGQQVSYTDLQADELPTAVPNGNDTSGLIRYEETYEYDAVGNIKTMQHQPLGGTYSAWTRTYTYATNSNRLATTTEPSGSGSTYVFSYDHDEHGSLTRMPHLPVMRWDYADQMLSCEKAVGTTDNVYFTYDSSGQRVRKTYLHAQYREERIYLGGYEIYRKWTVGPTDTLGVHRTTLHVMDDQRRVAMVENTIVDPDVAAGRRWRFQLDNHLGTATLELDQDGNVISYEEYHPYGSSALRVQKSGAGFSLKRYRYTGKERDEETSLYYHGARYYAPWLGRWTAADPLGVAQPGKPDLNVYAYGRGKVLNVIDPDGTQEVTPSMGFNSAEDRARATEVEIGNAKKTTVENADRVARTACEYTARTGTCGEYSDIRERAILKQNLAAHKEKYRFIPGTESERFAWRNAQKNPVVQRLLEHYQLNTGATLRLSEADMIALGTQVQIGWMPKNEDGSRPENPELAKLLAEGRAKWKATGKQVDLTVKFAGLATTSVPGGLGTMTAYFEGTLSIFDEKNWGFQGSMQFYDTYNFDKGTKNRQEEAVERLQIARDRLKGTPFAVVSDKIKVSQAGGDREAAWTGYGSDKKAVGGLTMLGTIGKTLAKLFR